MISRQEKNKVLEKKIKHEKSLKTSKKILKMFLLIILVFSLIFLYAYFIGIKGIFTKEYVLYEDLPNSFDGIKILHFSDILYGSTIKEKEIESLKEEIQLVNPDMVFFTGNIVDNKYALHEKDIKLLNDFFQSIPYNIGKYAVQGNLDTATFDVILDNTDFIILDNELKKIYYDDQDYLNIIGLSKDAKTISHDNNYTICLINNYDNYPNLSANLVFAGNNLGGEIKFLNMPLLGNNKYLNSYYQENNAQIYISSGLGTLHHMRLMNHPSINVYRLEKKVNNS